MVGPQRGVGMEIKRMYQTVHEGGRGLGKEEEEEEDEE